MSPMKFQVRVAPISFKGADVNTKKEIPMPEIPEYLQIDGLWDEFLLVRKAKKGTNSPFAIKLILKELDKLAPNDPHGQVAIVEQSIRSNWIDVYQVRDKGIRNGTVTVDVSFADRVAREQ